jgi:TPP-dependent pyruvate/acetoin dehydrogenase alpha subunit
VHNRAEVVHNNFLERVAAGVLPAAPRPTTLEEAGLSGPELVGIFESQVLSRHLDLESRRMQARGEGFYTIGSSGHEGNAAIGAAFRIDDMAFLHYRDAGHHLGELVIRCASQLHHCHVFGGVEPGMGHSTRASGFRADRVEPETPSRLEMARERGA